MGGISPLWTISKLHMYMFEYAHYWSLGWLTNFSMWTFKFVSFSWTNNLHFPEAVARRCFVKKVFLKISQKPQENTCARVSFLIKLQTSGTLCCIYGLIYIVCTQIFLIFCRLPPPILRTHTFLRTLSVLQTYLLCVALRFFFSQIFPELLKKTRFTFNIL